MLAGKTPLEDVKFSRGGSYYSFFNLGLGYFLITFARSNLSLT
jgi:hypothetical protein